MEVAVRNKRGVCEGGGGTRVASEGGQGRGRGKSEPASEFTQSHIVYCPCMCVAIYMQRLAV